jgi:hypothetical protein
MSNWSQYKYLNHEVRLSEEELTIWDDNNQIIRALGRLMWKLGIRSGLKI